MLIRIAVILLGLAVVLAYGTETSSGVLVALGIAAAILAAVEEMQSRA